jgi:Ser/Thr protein kinase RdoA (MazF antagonist)
MLCADERVVLFDFDNFVRGSAALDVADFASQLLTDTDFEVQRRTQLAARFIDHCMARFPHPPQWFELDWHLRALLLRKAYSFFVRHRAGWRERAGEAATMAARGVTQLIPDCLGSLS